MIIVVCLFRAIIRAVRDAKTANAPGNIAAGPAAENIAAGLAPENIAAGLAPDSNAAGPDSNAAAGRANASANKRKGDMIDNDRPSKAKRTALPPGVNVDRTPVSAILVSSSFHVS
jgi:hypothetical protein